MNKETLKSYLADYYQDSKVIDNILNAFAIELAALENTRIEMLNQLQPETATYSLSRWENDYRLENKDNYAYEFRRNIIIARMKGTGTCTKELIEQVCSAFANGSCEVIENTGEYSFDIKFTGVYGIPPNMTDVIRAINDIIPAHMTYKFIYKYLIWDNSDKENMTYDSLEYFSWDDWEIDNIHELEIITELNDEIIEEENNNIVSERIE